MVRENVWRMLVLTESIFIQTSPNIWMWCSSKLTVGATVQPPLISSCLVPETWIEFLDRTVKREQEQPSRAQRLPLV